MSLGLPVSQLINVQVNLAPEAAQALNFNSLLIIGDSNVIDVTERIRSYANIGGVAADFGTTAPEYLAALLYFSQQPRPNQLYIGRWAQGATSAILNCGALNATEQLPAAWTSITNGGVNFTIDGVARNLTALNFSSVTNMNAVASVINTALGANGHCTWTGSYLQVTSATTGVTSTITAAATGAGTSIAAQIKGTTALLQDIVNGIAAETALSALTTLDGGATQFYGVMFASTHIVNADNLACAAYCQAASNPHIYGVSSTDTNCYSAVSTTDIAYLLKAALYTRTCVQYSAIPYVIASLFGRALTTNFQANNSMITLMYKQEPGVVPETFTVAQAAALIAKRCNFFSNYNNNTAILQNAVMAGPNYFDEIQGTDWLANAIQTNVYNLLYQTATKIPQTDAGTHRIVTTVEATCAQAVNNGLVAPGTWSTDGFGTLNSGDFMPTGYYVYAEPVALQPSSDRAARKSVPIQVAVKLAGAIHSVDVIVNVNR